MQPEEQLPLTVVLLSKYPGRGRHLDPLSDLKSMAELQVRQFPEESQVSQSKLQARQLVFVASK